MKQTIYFITLVLLISCASGNKQLKTPLWVDKAFILTEISTDSLYGYSEKHPIEVAGASEKSGPLNERRFLSALAGPNGEQITYYRIGSCCPVKSDKGFMGVAMLDKYEISWDGAKSPIILYLNMYDGGVLKAPVGLTIAK